MSRFGNKKMARFLTLTPRCLVVILVLTRKYFRIEILR